MRNFTLLMGLLVAGSAAAESYTFVKPELSSAAKPKYYKIASDRVMDLGAVDPEAADTITTAEGLLEAKKSQYKSAGAVADNEGLFVDRPWLGLHGTTAAFSLYDSLVPSYTMYWRFERDESNSNPNALRIGNLASDMALNANANPMAIETGGPIVYVNDLSGMEYNAKKWVREESGSYVMVEVEDSVSTFAENSFCFSKSANFRNGKDCIDVNNYYSQPAASDPQVVYMKAVWNPFSDGIGNINNGSIFYFVEATEAEVAAAEAAYLASGDGQVFIDAARNNALNAFGVGFENVPSLYEAADIATAREAIEAMDFQASDCKSIAELNTMVSKVYATADKLMEPVFKNADKKLVTFECREIRPYEIVNEYGEIETIEEYAFLGAGHFKFSEVDSMGNYNDTIVPMSLVPILPDPVTYEPSDSCHWALIYVGGSYYNLYNPTLGVFISEEVSPLNQCWHTTWHAENAGRFQIIGIPEEGAEPDVVGLYMPSAGEQGYIHAAGEQTHSNIVRWSRSSGSSSDLGASASDWSLSVIGENVGLESIVVDKVENNVNTGIYDMTGRRISKITNSGLYIVNGKKMLIKK